MPTPQRRVDASVVDQLLAEPYRFEFCQAIRLLDTWLKRHGNVPGKTLFDYLRFQNHLSLAFPASQLEALTPVADTHIANADDLLAALLEQRLQHLSMRPAFMGLLGGNGSLPLHYTARLTAFEQREHDLGPRAFLDLFSNRSLAMFYEAWGKHRPECLSERGDGDAFLAMLLALAGVQPVGAAAGGGGDRSGGIAAATLGFYAAQLRNRCAPASVIGMVLSDYFGVPFVLEQLQGGWQELPPRHQAQLGQCQMPLAMGVLLGARIYRCDQRVRLIIGPLTRAVYQRFLPGTTCARALEKLLTLFSGTAMLFEVHLRLRAQDVGGFKLGEPDAARLGIDAFLLSAAAPADRTDMRYLIAI